MLGAILVRKLYRNVHFYPFLNASYKVNLVCFSFKNSDEQIVMLIILFNLLIIKVIPLGFEPKTHSLEGCCSNPTELRNLYRPFITKG